MVHHDGGEGAATGAEATTAAGEEQDGSKVAAADPGGKDQPILVPPDEGEDEVAIRGAQEAPATPSCKAPRASNPQAAGPVAFAHFRFEVGGSDGHWTPAPTCTFVVTCAPK